MKKAFPWLRHDKIEPVENGEVLIKGDKVVLREKRIEDAANDYAWRIDEELSRLDATRPLGMSYSSFVRYSCDDITYANPSSKRLAIDTLDGRHIGNCMYYDISLQRGEVELGIMIGDRAYWGQGYGTDSVVILLKHIFTTTPLNRVYLHTLVWNQRARRSFTKSGFRVVKKVRRGGMDFILMEILRSEWEQRQRLEESVDGNRPAVGSEIKHPPDQSDRQTGPA